MIKITLGCTAGSMGNSYTRAKGEVKFGMTHFLYDKNIFRLIEMWSGNEEFAR